MALDLSSIPTESLYKFQALSGLILSIGSIFYLYKQFDNTFLLLIKLKTDYKLIKQEADALQETIEESAKTIEEELLVNSNKISKKIDAASTLAKQKRNAVLKEIEKELKNHKQNGDIAQEKVKEIAVLINSVDIKLIKSEGKLNLIGYQYKKIRILSFLAAFTILGGGALSIVGFLRWRIMQQDIDQAIHLQATQPKK